MQLLDEDRLGGAMTDALRRRGVHVTPAVKNSVEELVRTLAPPRADGSDVQGFDATVTIMFTDIVDSTRLTESLGDRRAKEIVCAHDYIVRGQTRAHGGSEVKTMGDGFLLTFPSARRGVACAVAVQRELAVSGTEQSQARPPVRIGLSVGEPIRDDQDIFGRSVNLAARICARAEGGQILVSDVVRSLLAGSGEFRLGEVGPMDLKGVSEAQHVYEVDWRRS